MPNYVAALAAYCDGADFADVLIAQSNAAAGWSKTITVDRKAAKKRTHCAAM